MEEQEALKKKIKKRNGHQLVIKNTIAKAKELLPPPDEDTAPHAVTQLRPVGVSSDTYSAVLSRVIMSKLPKRIALAH